jgi:hypothetical protein
MRCEAPGNRIFVRGGGAKWNILMHVKYLGLCVLVPHEGTRLLCLTGFLGLACGVKRKTYVI